METNQEHCPHCQADLQGLPIAKEQQEAYGATHFGRKIGVYSKEYDRVIAWMCPDCEGRWDRDAAPIRTC